MNDEMILVPRAELLAWAKAWLSEYDPNDGTDCVTPFDTYLLKSPVETKPVGVEGLAADLETIWHSVSDDKETNAAYQRLKAALARQPAAEAPSSPYDRKRIAWELERTAMGDGYYGNALYVAKDFPEATPSERSLLDRWATGKESGLSDRTDLCAFALRVYAADEESPSVPMEARLPPRKNERGADGKFRTVYLFDTPREQGRFQQQVEAFYQQPASDGGFTAADMMDARKEGRKEAELRRQMVARDYLAGAADAESSGAPTGDDRWKALIDQWHPWGWRV